MLRFKNLTCGDSTSSNGIEKDLVRVFPGLIWGKEKEGVVGRCDLMCVECFQWIQLMVAVLMS